MSDSAKLREETYMSDSAKLRFVYALIFHVLSFFDLVAIVVLSFLIEFNIIPAYNVAFILLLAVVLVLLFMATIGYYKQLYYIGRKGY